jgi:anti-anti-sigma factor
MYMDISPLADKLVKVTLVGQLDTPGADSIETRFLASLVPNANNAIIDMSGVDFISSMGIRMLVAAARGLKMRQAVLAMYGVQAQVNQVLELVAINQMIPVCSTEAEAQAATGL